MSFYLNNDCVNNSSSNDLLRGILFMLEHKTGSFFKGTYYSMETNQV